MFRRAVLVLCLFAFGLCLGCEGETKPANPNNLEYGTEGPPKRSGPPADVKKK
jgi:hypothetical protein